MTFAHVRTAAVAAIAAVGLAVAAGCATPTASGANASAGPAAAPAGAAAPVHGQAEPVAAQNVGATPASPPYAGQRTISVTGVGTVTGTPDTLTVQLGVQTRAATAGAALAENNAKANALIAALTAHGVATKDIQTSQLSINPVYAGTDSTITGYEVSNSVTATLHDVSKAGAVIDSAGQAAGDAIRLNSVGFSFGDNSALRAQARADAVKQALAQAKQLADAAGVTVGQVLSISESATSSGPQPMYAMPQAAGGSDMPVQPGQQDLTVTVQVVVAIG